MSENFPEYQKINGLYKRHREGPLKGKFIHGEWATEELGYLANSEWFFTEKIDGTNCRIAALVDENGQVDTRVGGRTDKAQLHVDLVSVLNDVALKLEDWAHDHWEETTDIDNPASYSIILYGEGYGPGIQKGSGYREDKGFILFDVKIGHTWLRRADVEDVAVQLGLAVVPLYFIGDLHQAIELVRPGSGYGSLVAKDPECFEGLVGQPTVPLLDRRGTRIITKVKRADFEPRVYDLHTLTWRSPESLKASTE
jgi:hypothetical protein